MQSTYFEAMNLISSYSFFISFIAEYVGYPFVKFRLFVKDSYELRNKLQEIEENFPNNRVIEISLFQKEFVSVGPPSCVFE